MKGHYLCSLQGLEIAGHPLTLMVNDVPMSVMMESFYNMGDERHRRRLRRFIDAEDCMRKGIMDDRDVERATQEISNDIKEGQ